jgi:ketosteroid isomerase-like protein
MNKEQLIEQFGTVFNTLLTDPETAFAQYIDPQIVLENYLPEHVPFGGRYEGHQGLMQYLTQLAENHEMGSFEFADFYVDTDANTLIAVGAEKNAAGKAKGQRFDMPFAYVVKFNESGQMNYLREFNDTAAIGAAY